MPQVEYTNYFIRSQLFWHVLTHSIKIVKHEVLFPQRIMEN